MNETGADIANKEEPKEQETINARLEIDVAAILPILPEDTKPKIQVELDYDAITHVVNDYIERYTIDSRINEIDYQLSTPQLPDEDATNNLKECLTGEIGEVMTSNDTILVDNKAIVDNKVTLTFELSVEENVYLDEKVENPQPQQDRHQSEKSSRPNKSSVLSTKTSQPTNNQHKGELIIQSPNSNLYWQNAPLAELYWQNAPSNIFQPSNISQDNRTPVTDDEVLDDLKNIGSGLDSAMSSTDTRERRGYVMVGDNGRVYTNPHQRGNQHYKIVGKFSNNAYVRGLGWFGKVVSYGTTGVQMGMKYSQAETSQERGRVLGASVGQLSSGIIAGAIASTVTSTVLISVAVAAGVSTAPLTIVVIAGCSIMAAAAASNAVEQYGEDIGGNIGEKSVELWQNGVNKTDEFVEDLKGNVPEKSDSWLLETPEYMETAGNPFSPKGNEPVVKQTSTGKIWKQQDAANRYRRSKSLDD